MACLSGLCRFTWVAAFMPCERVGELADFTAQFTGELGRFLSSRRLRGHFLICFGSLPAACSDWPLPMGSLEESSDHCLTQGQFRRRKFRSDVDPIGGRVLATELPDSTPAQIRK